MKTRLSIADYKEGILSGNRVKLAQAITLVESGLDSDQDLASELIQEILPFTGSSIRIGITGVPGVGKSTFIESFGKMLLDSGKKVAVLAVDPTSQLTKGSILGDKTRMESLASDKRAFIRPSPSGNTLGGVSSKTREGLLLCEAAGFEVILIETVGVGQSETAVKGMVDFFLLLLLSGAGDELQGIKKGIMEMADALVIHKADGANLTQAKQAKKVCQSAIHYFPAKDNQWDPKVLLASSITKMGLSEIWELILGYEDTMKKNGFWEANRANQRLKWMEDQIQFWLGQVFKNNDSVKNELNLHREEIKNGTLHSSFFAKKLVQLVFTNPQ